MSERDDRHHQPSVGLMALLLAVGSVAVGGAYYAYLVAEPFPPDVVRLTPLLWLVGVTVSLALGLKAIRGQRGRVLGLLSVILSIPTGVCAVIFAMAALMGD